MNNHKTKPNGSKGYRVWIDQINQTYIDVKAESPEQAREKARRKWRKETFPETTQVEIHE